jgi:lipopolysaccharide transport system ATP-binding protein
MYVKLAFAVAAHLDSEIVIMDEVLAVGDMAFQKKCLRKMREAATMEGRTVLYVSHNMNTIRQLCDRCIVLNHGKIVFDGGVEEGIAVYMNQNDDMLPTYDYTDLVRSSDYNRQVEFRSVTLSAPADNRIPRGDDLPFTFTLAAKRRCDALFLRLEIFYLDDTVAGTVFSDKPIALDESGETAVSLSFNTTHLAPGKYKAVALAFERDRYGNEASLDRVEPAFLFEVTQQSENELLWLHSYWGHVRFDDMKVTEVKKA